MTPPDAETTAKPNPKTLSIHIDRKLYKTQSPTLTGAELRHLAEPNIGSHLDLYLEVPGSDDRLIGNDEAVELKPGMHFFSAPSTINPGRAR